MFFFYVFWLNTVASSAFCCFIFAVFLMCTDFIFYLYLIQYNHNYQKLTCFSRICDKYGSKNTQIQTGTCVGLFNLGEEIFLLIDKFQFCLLFDCTFIQVKIQYLCVIILFNIISSKNKILPTYILPTCLQTSKRMIWIHYYQNLVKQYQLEFYVIQIWSAKESDLPGNMRYIFILFSLDHLNFVVFIYLQNGLQRKM